MNISFRIAVVTALCIPLALSAAVPANPPTGGISGGAFGQYFRNLASTPAPLTPTTTCSSDSIIVGFDTTIGTSFLKPQCRNISDIFASLTSNLGLGTAASATHKLSVGGKLRVTLQTESTDTDDTVATKKYVDENSANGADKTATVEYICFGSGSDTECRSSWPDSTTATTIDTAGYEEKYINLEEDVYNSPVNGNVVDTCNGDRGFSHPANQSGNFGQYICAPSETRSCNDTYMSVSYSAVVGGIYSTTAKKRSVVCQGVRILAKNDANIKTALGVATIIGRDYGGSSEGCRISLSMPGVPSCTISRNSPKPSHWDDALCKKWLIGAVKNENYCPAFKGVIGTDWALSGNTGVFTIKYLGM